MKRFFFAAAVFLFAPGVGIRASDAESAKRLEGVIV